MSVDEGRAAVATPQAITNRHFPARIPGETAWSSVRSTQRRGQEQLIEWCHHTFNPWIGCQKVSEGCDLCYAERMNKFYKWNGGEWGPHAPRKRTSDAYWLQPLRWAKQAGDQRPRVFCASLADWLDNQAPQEWRVELAATIAATPELDWLLLTKRIENFDRLAPCVAAASGTQERLDRHDVREPGALHSTLALSLSHPCSHPLHQLRAGARPAAAR
jgi:Protein of unknown function (DUF5131)